MSLAVSILLLALLQAGCGGKQASRVDLNPPGDGEPPRETESYQIPDIPIDSPPVQVYQEIPVYPAAALDSGVEARVVIEVYVDESGTVREAFAEECSRPGLGFEEAAIKAAYLCRYKPAQSKLKKVGCWITYEVNFVLGD